MEFVWGRYSGLFYTALVTAIFIGLGIIFGNFWLYLATGGTFLFLIGVGDYSQKKRAVLGNFPLIGRLDLFLSQYAQNFDNIFGKQTMMNCHIHEINELWFIKDLNRYWRLDPSAQMKINI